MQGVSSIDPLDPLGVLDRTFAGFRVGCVALARALASGKEPRYHVFGHIHEGYGVSTDGTTTFINAACCTVRGQCTQPPMVFDVPIRQPTREPVETSAFLLPAQTCCCFTCLQELG